jgi:GDP-L-fucose synthase
MNRSSKILIAGARGLVGSAIVRRLEKLGYDNLLLIDRKRVDLTEQADVRKLFEVERPEYVFLAAAKVGGIIANETLKADFIRINLSIQSNVIESAWKTNVKKLLFFGSSCIYPKNCPQPIREEYLLTGPLEETNDAYAIAKIAGIKMCQSFNEQYGTRFISVMPTNLYGPNDNFDPETSHVLPAMIRKFHEANKRGDSKVILWGSGSPRREFLHVDDLADAAVFLMNVYEGTDIVNIGIGEDIAISELAEKIKFAFGYDGKLAWDASKPDGVSRKLLDVSRLHQMGWNHSVDLENGIRSTVEWYTSITALF